jgi:hypothetical protein
MSREEKKSIIYNMLENIEKDENAKFKFVSWFQKMAWYIDAGIPFSDGQLDEIIEFLDSLVI